MIIELGNESDFQDKIIVYPDLHVSFSNKFKTLIVDSHIDIKNIPILYWDEDKYEKWKKFYISIYDKFNNNFLKECEIGYRNSKKLKFNNITFFIPMTQKEYIKWKLVS